MVERCESFDANWSRFRADSVISRVGSTPGTHRLPPDAPELLDLCRRLYIATGGAVSPLVGRALEQWGYDSAYSLRPAASIDPVPRWEDAIAWDGQVLTTVGPVVLDVGAAGKGFLVDQLAAVLTSAGIRSFTIDASGDIRHVGATALRVALEHPLDRSKAIGVAELAGGAIAGSASNRRAWPGAHHMIDALSGLPTERVIATWATATTTAVADGVATALFFVDADTLADDFEFEWVRMLRSGVVHRSQGFPGEVFA